MYWSTQTSTFENIILIILALVVIVIFWWAIYAFVLSIFQFIFSKWEQEKVKKAWNNIRYMILGVILCIILLFLFPTLFNRFQIPGYQAYTAKNIFKKSTELIKLILNPTQQSTSIYNSPSSSQNSTQL